MTGPVRRSAAGRVLEAAGLAAVLGLAAWVRLARFARPLAAGELLAIDGDSHFHVRRIHAALRGELSAIDPLVNWPHGGLTPWTDGFDWLGAAFAWIAGGGRSGPPTEMAVFLWPVVLGVLAAWATVDLARRLAPAGDRSTPLAAGLVVAVMPHLVEVSSLGNVDHHVAEALSVVLLLSWSLRRFPVEEEGRAGWAWEIAGAMAIGFSLWVFVGGAVYVALVTVPLALAVAGTASGRRIVGSGAPALLAGAVLGGAANLPALAGHGRVFSFALPSMIQPGVVALAGLALAAAAVSGWRAPAGSGWRIAGPRLGAGLGVLVLALLLVPPLRAEIAAAVHGWMMGRDRWIGQIAEFQPIVRRAPGGGVDLLPILILLGPFGFLAIPALPLAAWVVARRSRARAGAFAWTAGVLTAMALLQLRFTRVAGPLLAVSLALALRGLSGWLARVPVAGRLAGPAPLVVVAGIVAGASGLRDLLVPSPPRAPSPVHQVALALRLDRPPVHGHGDGVLAPWDQGHAILQVSGRPVVANGFGTYLDPQGFEEVEAAYLGDEARFVATMERRDLGFAIGGGHALAGHQAAPGRGSMVEGDPPVLNLRWMKATPLSQLLIAGSGLPSAGVPHLERLMPVAASEAVAGGISFPLPLVWAFELVPGARITGRAAPGALVTGEIELREWGRPHRYRAWTRADGEGSFTLRVAVPTRFGAQAIETGRAWRITAGETPPVEVEVPEGAVRGGLVVPLP